MTSRLLAGLLPTALLEQYRFWQDPEDTLRGYPVDERDTDLRTKLEAVKDNAGDLMKFTTEADGIIRAARDEAAAEIAKAKDEAEKESSQKIGAAKAKLDAELKSAVSALEQQRAASMASIDTEVNKLSDSIVNKVLVSA